MLAERVRDGHKFILIDLIKLIKKQKSRSYLFSIDIFLSTLSDGKKLY